jgi:hypothetical protein
VYQCSRSRFPGALLAVLLLGCPLSNDNTRPLDAGPALVLDAAPPVQRPTHSGLVSLQEIAIANLAESTRTLTLQALFSAASAPDFDEAPGQPTGCKAWLYDVAVRPPPVEQDQGALYLGNLRGGDLRCRFQAGRGYACAALADTDGGLLPDLRAYGLPDATKLTFSGLDGGAFELPPTELTPGAPFTIDTRSRALIDAIPLSGEALRLSCEGDGGSCGAAAATIVRISATDGDTTGLGPTAMPPPAKRAVEINCAVLGAGTLTVPAPAMALLAQAHAASPLRRVRAAFMRDGVAVLVNAAPKPPNRLVLAAGRALIGFTNP